MKVSTRDTWAAGTLDTQQRFWYEASYVISWRTTIAWQPGLGDAASALVY